MRFITGIFFLTTILLVGACAFFQHPTDTEANASKPKPLVKMEAPKSD